jgi:GntR family transcriptional regulator
VGLLEAAPTLDRQSSVPIFTQVKSTIAEAVSSGELQPHRRIPSERELAAMFGVSRMTIRQALLELINEGSLYTRSGKGTYVAERKIAQPLQRLTSFTQDMAARGMRPSSRLLGADLLPAPIELAHALSIPAGSELVRIRRLRLADGQPLAIETSHLPHARCPGILDHDLQQHSLYELLRDRYDLELASAKQTIEAALPDEEERQLLDLPPGVPVLRIHRFTANRDGLVCEFVQSAYRGDRYQLNVDLT